jgi:hypothetical protein
MYTGSGMDAGKTARSNYLLINQIKMESKQKKKLLKILYILLILAG